MKIIVGLGNPGAKYENTYHNVGFWAVDKFCQKLGATYSLKPKLQSLVAQTNLSGEKVVVVKPQTFMNLSGDAVLAVMNFFKADLSDLIVVYDDLDIDVGALRIRKNGSAGTHNGMRNIVDRLATDNFARVRIGTKNDNPLISTIDYVLSAVTQEKHQKIDGVCADIASVLTDFVLGVSFDKIMCKYNKK